MDPWLVITLTALVGLAAGTAGSMVGAGGGFLIMPFLLLVLHLDHSPAVATSLVAVFATACGATFAYARLKRIDYRTAGLMAVAMIPGVVTGALVTQALSGPVFQIFFATFMAVVAAMLVARSFRGKASVVTTKAGNGWTRKITDAEGTTYEYVINPWAAGAAALIGGVLSAAFGIGGGTILVPLLVTVLLVPVHVATATSALVMIPMTMWGVFNHELLEPGIEWEVAIPLAAGVLIGSQIGARLSQKIRAKPLVWAVAGAVALLAIILAVEGARGLLTG